MGCFKATSKGKTLRGSPLRKLTYVCAFVRLMVTLRDSREILVTKITIHTAFRSMSPNNDAQKYA